MCVNVKTDLANRLSYNYFILLHPLLLEWHNGKTKSFCCEGTVLTGTPPSCPGLDHVDFLPSSGFLSK